MKEFEDKFSELQADMISVCMEYVENRADKVYVYASCEEGMVSSKFFYCINNKSVKAHKINDALENGGERYDLSPKRQMMVLDIINEDIRKIEALCEEYERDMPTEMKLIYEVKSSKFQAQYQYDLVHSNDDVKIPDDFAYEWFEEVKSNNL